MNNYFYQLPRINVNPPSNSELSHQRDPAQSAANLKRIIQSLAQRSSPGISDLELNVIVLINRGLADSVFKMNFFSKMTTSFAEVSEIDFLIWNYAELSEIFNQWVQWILAEQPQVSLSLSLQNQLAHYAFFKIFIFSHAGLPNRELALTFFQWLGDLDFNIDARKSLIINWIFNHSGRITYHEAQAFLKLYAFFKDYKTQTKLYLQELCCRSPLSLEYKLLGLDLSIPFIDLIQNFHCDLQNSPLIRDFQMFLEAKLKDDWVDLKGYELVFNKYLQKYTPQKIQEQLLSSNRIAEAAFVYGLLLDDLPLSYKQKTLAVLNLGRAQQVLNILAKTYPKFGAALLKFSQFPVSFCAFILHEKALLPYFTSEPLWQKSFVKDLAAGQDFYITYWRQGLASKKISELTPENSLDTEIIKLVLGEIVIGLSQCDVSSPYNFKLRINSSVLPELLRKFFESGDQQLQLRYELDQLFAAKLENITSVSQLIRAKQPKKPNLTPSQSSKGLWRPVELTPSEELTTTLSLILYKIEANWIKNSPRLDYLKEKLSASRLGWEIPLDDEFIASLKQLYDSMTTEEEVSVAILSLVVNLFGFTVPEPYRDLKLKKSILEINKDFKAAIRMLTAYNQSQRRAIFRSEIPPEEMVLAMVDMMLDLKWREIKAKLEAIHLRPTDVQRIVSSEAENIKKNCFFLQECQGQFQVWPMFAQFSLSYLRCFEPMRALPPFTDFKRKLNFAEVEKFIQSLSAGALVLTRKKIINTGMGEVVSKKRKFTDQTAGAPLAKKRNVGNRQFTSFEQEGLVEPSVSFDNFWSEMSQENKEYLLLQSTLGSPEKESVI